MTLITVEGVYQNGKVELLELPQGVARAKVMVTFLAETNVRPKKPVRKAGASGGQEKGTPVKGERRYPQALRDEYAALIHKKLQRTLTMEETSRLEAVRAEINRRDLQSESWSMQERDAAEIDGEIADLQKELEALPDA